MPDFFIDYNRGNDSNNGLTKDTAWKTLEKFRVEASSGNITAGSNVLLESSSIFNESRYLRFGTGTSELFNGTENARTIIGKYDYTSSYSGNPRVQWAVTPVSSDWIFDSSLGLWYISPEIQYSNSNQQWGGHPRVTINGNLCPIVRYESSTFSRGNYPTLDNEVFTYEVTQPGRLYLYSPASINPSLYYGEGSIKAAPTQRGIFAFSCCGSYITIQDLEIFESGKLATLYSDATSIGNLVGFCLQNNFANKIGVFADVSALDSSKFITDVKICNNEIKEVGGIGIQLGGYLNGIFVSKNHHIFGNMARSDGGAVYIQGGTDRGMKGVVIENNLYEKMNANVKGSESDGCAVYCEVGADGVVVSQNTVKDSYMAFQDNSGRNNFWVSNLALNCDSFIKVTDENSIAEE